MLHNVNVHHLILSLLPSYLFVCSKSRNDRGVCSIYYSGSYHWQVLEFMVSG